MLTILGINEISSAVSWLPYVFLFYLRNPVRASNQTNLFRITTICAPRLNSASNYGPDLAMDMHSAYIYIYIYIAYSSP